MPTLKLPIADGTLFPFTPSMPQNLPKRTNRPFNRIAYAAAHVVADPLADVDPWMEPAIDWDTTISYRTKLFDLGLGVAEAMDTAQRGTGLDWTTSQELIRRSLETARHIPAARIACGAGTDHLVPGADVRLEDVIRAYEEQVAFVEKQGGRVILMASRALAACATSPDDYVTVYERILSQVREPVLVHWLGEMFDLNLRGYWGRVDHVAAMDVCLDILPDTAAKIEGIKVSLLDKEKEIVMRRRLPDGVRMYTGDDFHYAELIAGDEVGYSDALLGIFDAIAPAASAALDAISGGDEDRFHKILAPTVPLSRHIFKSPTSYYKTGVVFMAWLNGHQEHFVMVGGQQSARSILHLAELFRLADASGLLADPEMASSRMRAFLTTHGVAA